MPKQKSPNKIALVIALVAVLGGMAYWLTQLKEEAELQQVQTDLTRMTMAQAIAHCRALWTAGHYDQAPLAIAWHKDGLDWYVLEGLDNATMRHFGCDGSSVTRGARYPRGAQEVSRQVPAPVNEPRSIPIDRNLFTHYSALPEAGLRAFEATEHPATGELMERRWSRDGTLQSTMHDRDFPILFRHQPEGVALGNHPLLTALPATVWIRDPARVFALLEKELPRGARIAELSFDDRSITLRILGTFKNDAEKTTAPFGEASFDEYGIRNDNSWYPRDQTGASCRQGHTLNQIIPQFAQATNATNPKVSSATFNCDGGKGKVTETGSWKLRVPRQR